ncbi:MAG: hypothetical protein U1G08_11380 [Verrucomicrobiota bacterium]
MTPRSNPPSRNLRIRPASTLPPIAKAGMALALVGGGLQAADPVATTNAPAASPAPVPAPYTYPAPQFNPLAWQPYPGLLNTWLREQSPEFNKWNVGAWERFRYESRNYFAANGAGPLAVDFNAASPVAHNNYSLFRTQLWLGYAPTEWIRAFVEA